MHLSKSIYFGFCSVILLSIICLLVSPSNWVRAEPMPAGLNIQIQSSSIDIANTKIIASNQLIISAKQVSNTNLTKLQQLKIDQVLNITKIQELRPGKVYKLSFGESINSSLINLLESQNWIAKVALNPIEKTQSIINDPHINTYPTAIINQSYVDILDRLRPLATTTPTIAVIDSAFDTTHIDLEPNMLGGIDFADGDNDVNMPTQYKVGTSNQNITNRPLFHGSMVAGVIAAASNGDGGVGICPWCKIKPYKTSTSDEILIDQSGNIVTPGLYQDSMIASIYSSISRGIKIINISAGSNIYSSVYQEVVDYAASQGVIIVASSGNDNTSQLFWPASFESVISVTSINRDLTKSSYSNYGPSVDISVPVDTGLVTPVYKNNQGLNLWSLRALGTSFASPVVSGLIGLVTSIYPSITSNQIRQLLASPNLTSELNSVNLNYTNQLGKVLNPSQFIGILSNVGLNSALAGNTNTPLQIISSNLAYTPDRSKLPRYNGPDNVSISLNNIQTLGTNQPLNWLCQLYIKDYYSPAWFAIGASQLYNQSTGCSSILLSNQRTNIAYLDIRWELTSVEALTITPSQFYIEDLLVFEFSGIGRSD